MVQHHSLPSNQLDSLNAAINRLMQDCFFSTMSSLFEAKNYTPFSDIVNDSLFMGAGGTVTSNTGKRILKFNDLAGMSPGYKEETILEEFFHLYQKHEYDSTGYCLSRSSEGYLEFEAYLLYDMNALKNGKTTYAEHYFALKDHHDIDTKYEYLSWLGTVTNQITQLHVAIDFSNYKEWAIRFAETNNKYKYFGYTFDDNLPPVALTSIFNAFDCPNN